MRVMSHHPVDLNGFRRILVPKQFSVAMSRFLFSRVAAFAMVAVATGKVALA